MDKGWIDDIAGELIWNSKAKTNRSNRPLFHSFPDTYVRIGTIQDEFDDSIRLFQPRAFGQSDWESQGVEFQHGCSPGESMINQNGNSQLRTWDSTEEEEDIEDGLDPWEK